MNPTQLLAHFEKLADAPDAILHLRRFILDLAVRGKLVPQNSKDEPASELLRRISLEKSQLAKSGAIKKDKTYSAIDDSGVFGIPPTWCWTHLGKITSYIQRGKSPKYAAADGTLVVSQKCIQWDGLILGAAKQITWESLVDYEEIRFLTTGDLLWNSTGTGTIGRIIRVVDPPRRLVCDSHVTVVRCLLVDPEYIRTWLRSDHVYALIEDRAAGSTNQVELTLQMAFNQVVPLPPFAEQRRIIARVDELMALCDRLEAARAERESRRDRFAWSSLARLNTPDPDTFNDDAKFAFAAMAAITARPDQVKQFRQTILNLAVRGKLVPQDAADEPAAKLVQEIVITKARPIKSGEVKPEGSMKALAVKAELFDVPQGWKWVRLDHLCHLITKGSSPKWQGVNYVPQSNGLLFITSENVGHYRLRKLDSLKFVEARFREIEPRSMLSRGDILMNLVGASIGRVALYDMDTPANINQAVALIRLIKSPSAPYVDYLMHYLNSPPAIEFMLGSRVTTAQPNMSLTDAREFPIPLPPLHEQHRIVIRIDQLVTVCDQLEASLIAEEELRFGFLKAVLSETLRPTEERDEAA